MSILWVMSRLIVTAILLLAALPAWADFEAGAAALERGDFATAMAEWTATADDGDAMSQLGLGSLYRYGRGVELDLAQAAAWYRKAAEQGNAQAQFELAVLLQKGDGIGQDFDEAIKWYERAANQHMHVAQFNLGMMYGQGIGADRDRIAGLTWLSLAAALGNTRGRGAAIDLSRKMPQEEIDEARRRAQAWIERQRDP